MVYLDYNATTPVDQRVIDTMMDAYENHPGNAGSRTHVIGDDCRRIVEKARTQVAALGGIDSSGVIFTSGATESDNIALRGLAEYGRNTGRMHLLISSIEHKAVINSAKVLANEGFDVEWIPVDKTGSISVADAMERVRHDTLLVSVMHVNNETGVIQPVRELGERIADDYPETFFHIDAAQSFGKLVSDIRTLTYSMMSVTAHKMYGPQGIGALLLRQQSYAFPPVRSVLLGGGQERGISPGTQPVALIAGFGKAAELSSACWVADCAMERGIRDSLLSALDASGLSYDINGLSSLCTPNCINVSFEGVSSEALMMMTRQKLSISNGSACTSGSYEPSYVLMAMGLGRDRAESAIRISWGRMSDVTDVSEAFEGLIEVAKELQGIA